MKQCRVEGASRQQCRWFPLLIERFFSPSSRQRLTTSYRCGKQVFISVLSPLPSILPSHKYVITIIQHPAIQIPITFCHSSTVATRFEDKSANVDRVLQGRYLLATGPRPQHQQSNSHFVATFTVTVTTMWHYVVLEYKDKKGRTIIRLFPMLPTIVL